MNPEGGEVLVPLRQGWIVPAPVRTPAGLSHIDSEFCWCEPMVELDDDGQLIVIHREVTWN
jgi:hypothetical protein